MEAVAITKNARMSAFKVREVARLIQGKRAVAAKATLELMPRKAARILCKTLTSAIANAENSEKGTPVPAANLIIKEAAIGEGMTMRRFRPKARGMAGRVRKRSSNIRIVLSD